MALPEKIDGVAIQRFLCKKSSDSLSGETLSHSSRDNHTTSSSTSPSLLPICILLSILTTSTTTQQDAPPSLLPGLLRFPPPTRLHHSRLPSNPRPRRRYIPCSFSQWLLNQNLLPKLLRLLHVQAPYARHQLRPCQRRNRFRHAHLTPVRDRRQNPPANAPKCHFPRRRTDRLCSLQMAPLTLGCAHLSLSSGG